MRNQTTMTITDQITIRLIVNIRGHSLA